MLMLPTVLLRHDTVAGTHYDWLLGDPREPRGRLWAARVAVASTSWPALRRWDLEPIAPHRRHYLTYQGPIAGNRGRVTRIDAGTFIARLWTASRIVLDLRLHACEGVVELRRVSLSLWRACFISPSPVIDDDVDLFLTQARC